jgi:hypothetical protein
MRNKYLHFLLLTLAPLLFLAGCQDEELVDDSPAIVLSTSQQLLNDLDLDKTTGPNVRGWATAPAGLKRVSVVVEKASGDEEILEVTSFTEENSEKNGTAYNFNVYPVYTPDFRAIRIAVVDQQDRRAEEILSVEAKGGETGPALSLPAGPIDANIRPSVDIRPTIEGTASTHWRLKYLSIIEVRNGQEQEVERITEFDEEEETRYAIVYDPAYDLELEALKIVAVDNRDNRTEHVIQTNVIDASPAPTVEFEQESVEADLTADPQVTPEVSGTVASEFEGLAEVRFYLVYSDRDEEIESEAQSFGEDVHEHEFAFTPEYALDVRGIKVVATDHAGQVTSQTLPVSVIAEDPDLLTYQNIDLWATGERSNQPTAFSVTDGNAYIYDQEPAKNEAIARSVHFIAAAPSGDNASYDVFAPSAGWLDNNYFKEVVWPHRNATLLRELEEGELDFEKANSIAIKALPIGETTDRVRAIQDSPSRTILFETEDGNRGLIYFVGSDEALSKKDKMTFHIKYVTQ